MLRVWGSEDPDCRVQGTVLGSRIQWTQRESSPCSLCSDRQAGSRLLLPLCAPPLPVCAPPCHPLAEGRVHLNMDPTHCGNEILCGFICFVCLYKGMASVGNAGDKGEQCWGGVVVPKAWWSPPWQPSLYPTPCTSRLSTSSHPLN